MAVLQERITNMLAKIKKDDLSSVVDIWSGILYAQIHFYQAAMAIGALLFISLFSPESKISKIIPAFDIRFMEDIKNEFLSGEISNIIFNFFIIFEVFRIIFYLLGVYSKEQIREKIIETIGGIIAVYIVVLNNPILTIDRIIFNIIGFYTMLLLLNVLTRIFSIDTRHFGYKYKKNFNRAVAKDGENIGDFIKK